MEALKTIPRVLQGIEDIHHNTNPTQVLNEYKRNVKEFIKNITKEVEVIIQQYEKKITELKEENRRLKERGEPTDLPLQTVVKNTANRDTPSSSKFTHSGKKTPNLQLMQTAKSNIFSPQPNRFDDEDIRFSAVLSKYKRSKDQDNNFPVELINPEPGEDQDFHQGKSHFQIKSNRKKQREQQLVNFLQTGKKNLNHTTKRFLQSIGRGQQKNTQDEEQQLELNRDNSDSSLSRKNDSGLNQSLGNICNSLDNSFVAKRARSGRKKKSGQIEEQARRKQKQDQEIAKMMKSKGIKNLLMRLRENVDASPQKSPQIIKSSKLISCGAPKTAGNDLTFSNTKKNNSKVMINPVPVDIVRKSMVSKKDRSPSPQPSSPTKKPQSILKQSSIIKNDSSPTKSILKQTSTVLSKSISGISVIEFAD